MDESFGQLASLEPVEVELDSPKIELKKLSQKHRDVATLVAQGVGRGDIAQIVGYTPEYVTWLQGQPLFIEYIRTMNAAVATQLEAMFQKTVDVIQDTMNTGSEDGRLKAAKLQLEATGRVGRYQVQAPSGDGKDRLEQLSGRLLELLIRQRSNANGRVLEGQATVLNAEDV